MNRVAVEIADEIGVFFQHRHLHAGPREQITGHHSGGAAADDDAARLQFLRLIHCNHLRNHGLHE